MGYSKHVAVSPDWGGTFLNAFTFGQPDMDYGQCLCSPYDANGQVVFFLFFPAQIRGGLSAKYRFL